MWYPIIEIKNISTKKSNVLKLILEKIYLSKLLISDKKIIMAIFLIILFRHRTKLC